MTSVRHSDLYVSPTTLKDCWTTMACWMKSKTISLKKMQMNRHEVFEEKPRLRVIRGKTA
jgi:hypothetical protein